MARVIITDCLEKVESRFELVLIAAKRARQLTLGAAPRIEDTGDKPTVTALREIAQGVTDASILDEEMTLPDFHFDEDRRAIDSELSHLLGGDVGGDGGDGDASIESLFSAKPAPDEDETI